MATFVRSHFSFIIALAVIVAYGVFVFTQLTTYPRLWLDEGFKMQLARNFSDSGVMAMQFEPDKPEYTIHNASTGWPVVFGLGTFFKLFGTNFAVGRIFSGLYLVGFIVLVYFLIKREWGSIFALTSLLLLVTYAPLYANGKMILAEIPGLFWLALGFLFLFQKRSPGWIGLAFGLFAASKLAFAATFLPALAMGNLFAIRVGELNWRDLAKQWAVILLVIAPTIFMALTANLESGSYYNPYDQISLLAGALTNLKLFLTHSTLWHFLGLLFVSGFVTVRIWRHGEHDWRIITLGIYGLLVLIYWFLSPAVFRYLLPLVIMLLALLPITLGLIMPKYAKFLILILVIVQGAHFITGSSISHGSKLLEFEKYVKEGNIPQNFNIGIINSSFAPVLLPTEQVTQFFRIDGLPEGRHPLSAATTSWPDILIYEKDGYEEDVAPYKEQIESIYFKEKEFGTLSLWKKK